MNKLKLKEQSDKLLHLHIEIAGFYNECAKMHGLTLAAFKVLHRLYCEEKCTQKQITQMTYLPKQTVNAIIKSFQEQGIIDLCVETDSDKRNKLVTFTKDGQKYADKVIATIRDVEYRALDGLGETRVNNLIETVIMYKENLKL